MLYFLSKAKLIKLIQFVHSVFLLRMNGTQWKSHVWHILSQESLTVLW